MTLPDEDDAAAYELVMPFVVVHSRGGPHDDTAFVAGWRLGALDRDLAVAAVIGTRHHVTTVPPCDLPQVDLIAMKHGYKTTAEPWDEAPAEWATVTFERIEEMM